MVNFDDKEGNFIAVIRQCKKNLFEKKYKIKNKYTL